jgi:hypothetical protein
MCSLSDSVCETGLFGVGPKFVIRWEGAQNKRSVTFGFM